MLRRTLTLVVEGGDVGIVIKKTINETSHDDAPQHAHICWTTPILILGPLFGHKVCRGCETITVTEVTVTTSELAPAAR